MYKTIEKELVDILKLVSNTKTNKYNYYVGKAPTNVQNYVSIRDVSTKRTWPFDSKIPLIQITIAHTSYTTAKEMADNVIDVLAIYKGKIDLDIESISIENQTNLFENGLEYQFVDVQVVCRNM
jgi:hypothetical protein